MEACFCGGFVAQWFMVTLVRHPGFESRSCRFFAFPFSPFSPSRLNSTSVRRSIYLSYFVIVTIQLGIAKFIVINLYTYIIIIVTGYKKRAHFAHVDDFPFVILCCSAFNVLPVAVSHH